MIPSVEVENILPSKDQPTTQRDPFHALEFPISVGAFGNGCDADQFIPSVDEIRNVLRIAES